MSKIRLSNAQLKALVAASADRNGKLFNGYGVSLPTVRYLESLGLVAVVSKVRRDEYTRAGRLRIGRRCPLYVEWTATITEAGRAYIAELQS